MMKISTVRSKSFVSLAMKVAAAGTGFAMNIAVTRSLGADVAGVFFLALSVVTIAAVFARAGMDLTLVRIVGQDNSTTPEPLSHSAVRTALLVSFVIGSALSIGIFLFGPDIATKAFKSPALASVLPILCLAIVPMALSYLIGHAFQGSGRPYRFLVYQNFGITLVFSLLLVGGWAVNGDGGVSLDVETTSMIYVVAAGLLTLSSLFDWYQQLPTRVGRLPFSARELLSISQPVLGVSLLAILNQYVVQLSLGVWASTADVAIYAIAFRVAAIMTMILAAIDSIIAPRFAHMHRNNDLRGMSRLAKESTNNMLAWGTPVCIILLAIPEHVLTIFGSEFSAGAGVLRILLFGQMINLATGAVGTILIMTGNARCAALSSLVAALVLGLLCVALIPRYGIIGGAIAQSVALSGQMLMNSWWTYRKLGFAPVPFSK